VADASNRYLAGYQDNELGILLNIYKQPGANVIETVDRIKAELSRLTANLPPRHDGRNHLRPDRDHSRFGV
jgi:multidrug efflux pump subunit AcrB